MSKTNILAFIFGAGIGACVTYVATKNYYEDVIDDEINSVKEYYEARHEERKKAAEKQKKADLSEYKTILEDEGYVKKPSEVVEDEGEEETDMVAYEISEDQFDNENPDYDKVTLNYYQNDILTDDVDEKIDAEKIPEIIGDALKKFDDPEVGTVYARNDILKGDYEILRVLEDY